MKTDILSFVLENLRAESVPLSSVCRDTGLKQSWLYQLKVGLIPDPGVRKIQILAGYFRRKKAPRRASQESSSVSA